jgi:negative regulator of sigma E activity
LPPGFELVSLYEAEEQSHACYSDGICELSAFFTQVNKSEPYALQENQSGSFSGITQSVTLTKNNYQLTLCGHIPIETLQQVMLNFH